MPDHCNRPSSFNIPDYDRRKADVEFNFWGDEDGGEMEFPGNFEQEFDDFSLGLWKTNKTSRNVRNETSRLLPHNHHYSNISPISQSQAIAEARKELMERIHDVPESSYELSLKDIVNEQEQERVHQENATDGTSFNFSTDETPINKKNTKKPKNIIKSGQISRTASMETETFLIKMFVPSLLSWKMKVRGNDSKVSPRPSIHGSDNHVDKEWGIKRFLSPRDSKRSERSNSSSSCSSRSSFKGCWLFFCTKKGMKKRHRG